jgi:hypothetical protein
MKDRRRRCCKALPAHPAKEFGYGRTLYGVKKLDVLAPTTAFGAAHRTDHLRSREPFAIVGAGRLFYYVGHDLPLNVHSAAVRAAANVTPFGAVSVPA